MVVQRGDQARIMLNRRILPLKYPLYRGWEWLRRVMTQGSIPADETMHNALLTELHRSLNFKSGDYSLRVTTALINAQAKKILVICLFQIQRSFRFQ